MSDRDISANSEIAAAKAQTESFRERLAARRQKRNQLIAAATNSTLPLNLPGALNMAAIFAAKNRTEQSKLSVLPTIPKSPHDKSSTNKHSDEGILSILSDVLIF